MIFNIKMIEKVYLSHSEKIKEVRRVLNRPLTLTEKILYTHLHKSETIKDFKRGVDYVNFMPDRVAMQDATAQMAMLQFMTSGKDTVNLPTTIHCDHLIQAYKSAKDDLRESEVTNKEVFDFLATVSNRYGIGFWKPGAGIIHQVLLENYVFPGGLMVGTDSHTPNAGGLGMLAIGVGGAEAVDVMAGMPWELRMPQIIGVKLTGRLSGWSSPKDIILKLAGILTVKGGTNAVIEYFGEGTKSISATGKATVCNMGAEVGATSSLFPFDDKSAEYLIHTKRKKIADMALKLQNSLCTDLEVEAMPEKYYDRVIEINLDELEPHINGPYTPDAAHKLSNLAEIIKQNQYPQTMEVGLIGSCTNSSYEDMMRAASVIQDALDKDVEVKSQFFINPGSEQIRYTIERDGVLDTFEKAGATIIANACGPCIGQWNRITDDPNRPNSIMTSFNRNFARRNDGNLSTHAFVASPEIVAAFTIAGDLTFNPMTDSLINKKGEKVKLAEPHGNEFPKKGFDVKDLGYIEPKKEGRTVEVIIDPKSNRLQRLESFPAWDKKDMINKLLLIKVKGTCTTDHISMAGPWLRYRGHLDNISENMLIGAENAFNGKANYVLNPTTNGYMAVPAVARDLKDRGLGSIVIAENNYGEGSSREHAAMEPRYLNVEAIIVKSFARIHETNLKKQGVLALTFANESNYEKIREEDKISILGLVDFQPNKNLTVRLTHKDKTTEEFEVTHTYNELQIEWFKAGSALNYMKLKEKQHT